ncbi:hypothetical protein SK128_025812, partial [Halocaridina rubra]
MEKLLGEGTSISYRGKGKPKLSCLITKGFGFQNKQNRVFIPTKGEKRDAAAIRNRERRHIDGTQDKCRYTPEGFRRAKCFKN